MIDCMMTSGAEILATEIAMALDPDRFESILCSTRPSASVYVEAARRANVDVLELGRRSKLDIWRWMPLVRLLRSGRVDVLHAHKIGSNFWAAIFSCFAEVPVLIAHEHTWSFQGNRLRRFVDRELIARRATKFLAVSESDREKMIKVERIPADKITVVANGIPDRPPEDGARARAALAIPAGVPVMGTVCALRPQKALEVALEASARLAHDYPGLRFVVVGDGPDRARLEQVAARVGAPAIFVGRRPNAEIPGLLAAMDVLVSSSSFEGSPLAVLEWMAAAKPIVATRVGGIPSIIDHGEQGLLVDTGDATGMAAAVARLLADPDERRRLGEAARRRQQAEFRLERTVETLQGLYEALYAARGG
jgi:glycosyltransferase involved in cell wall biosynthesis